jgi:hypothetical protein
MAAKDGPTTGNDAGVEIYPVTPDRWDDLVDLFERKGLRGGTPMPGHCWGMYWREEQGPRPLRKAAMKACIDTGRLPGYGPCPGDRGVFAVTCFYVDRTRVG